MLIITVEVDPSIVDDIKKAIDIIDSKEDINVKLSKLFIFRDKHNKCTKNHWHLFRLFNSFDPKEYTEKEMREKMIEYKFREFKQLSTSTSYNPSLLIQKE